MGPRARRWRRHVRRTAPTQLQVGLRPPAAPSSQERSWPVLPSWLARSVVVGASVVDGGAVEVGIGLVGGATTTLVDGTTVGTTVVSRELDGAGDDVATVDGAVAGSPPAAASVSDRVSTKPNTATIDTPARRSAPIAIRRGRRVAPRSAGGETGAVDMGSARDGSEGWVSDSNGGVGGQSAPDTMSFTSGPRSHTEPPSSPSITAPKIPVRSVRNGDTPTADADDAGESVYRSFVSPRPNVAASMIASKPSGSL